MSAVETLAGPDELKTRLRDTWMTGDYGRFSRYMERDAEAFFRRLPINPRRAVARRGMRSGAAIADCGESRSACDRL